MNSSGNWYAAQQHYEDLLKDAERHRAEKQLLDAIKEDKEQSSLPSRFVRWLLGLWRRRPLIQEVDSLKGNWILDDPATLTVGHEGEGCHQP